MLRRLLNLNKAVAGFFLAILSCVLTQSAAHPTPGSITINPAEGPWLYRRQGIPSDDAPSLVELIAVGDVMPGRDLADQPGLFDLVAADLQGADLVFGNLEGAITTHTSSTTGYNLSIPPSAANTLAKAGFDLLGLANNHSLDAGTSGLLMTRSLLRLNGITPLPAAQPAYKSIKGITFAFLAWNEVPPTDREVLFQSIQSARPKADVVILLLHWGREYDRDPNLQQRELAEDLFQVGADIIIGAHPHVVQDIQLLPPPANAALHDAGPVYSVAPNTIPGIHPTASNSILGINPPAPAASPGFHPPAHSAVPGDDHLWLTAQHALPGFHPPAPAAVPSNDNPGSHAQHAVAGEDSSTQPPRLVAYSLGNFAFDQGWDDTGQGLALRLLFDSRGLYAAQALPLHTAPRPAWMFPAEAADLLNRILPIKRIGYRCKSTTCRQVEVPQERASGLFWSGAIDLTGDGVPEIVRREGKKVTIYQNGEPAWSSPTARQVTDLALGDPNHDGRYELLAAFQQAGESGATTSHPFVIGYRGGIYRVLWGGSPVEYPLLEVELADLDGDGTQELAVIETSPDGNDRYLSLWRWNGWGFSLIWRSPAGNYHDLVLFLSPDDDTPPILSVSTQTAFSQP